MIRPNKGEEADAHVMGPHQRISDKICQHIIFSPFVKHLSSRKAQLFSPLKKKKTTPANFCSRLNPLPLPVNLFYPHRIEIRCHSHIFTHPSLLSDGQMAGGSHLLQRPSDRIASVRWRWNFAHISPLTRTKRKRKRKLNLVATAAGLLLGPRFTPAATRAVRQFLDTLSYFQPQICNWVRLSRASIFCQGSTFGFDVSSVISSFCPSDVPFSVQ